MINYNSLFTEAIIHSVNQDPLLLKSHSVFCWLHSPAVTQLLKVGSVPLGALQTYRHQKWPRWKMTTGPLNKCPVLNNRRKKTKQKKQIKQNSSPGRRGQRWAWPCPSGPGSAASRCQWTPCTPSGCSSCAAPAHCGSERAEGKIGTCLLFIDFWMQEVKDLYAEVVKWVWLNDAERPKWFYYDEVFAFAK